MNITYMRVVVSIENYLENDAIVSTYKMINEILNL